MKENNMNLLDELLDTDSYKHSHWNQYPKGTEIVNSYIEARSSTEGFKEVVFMGLQPWLDNLRNEFLQGITDADIDKTFDVLEDHFLGNGEFLNRDGWKKLRKYVEDHNVLPLTIEAVPEGTIINTQNCLVQIRNTHPDFWWLPSFLETSLLRAIWYPTTVATVSYHAKKIIYKYLQETGNVAGLGFKLHDFGARGASSKETAAVGGTSHLVNFQGTDTLSAIQYISKHYDEDRMTGYSIPAAEHSTVTSWGIENEELCYKHIFESYNTPLVAVVSDSFDIYNAVSNIWGGKVLKEIIMNGKKVLVIRPDSGDPVKVTLEIANRIMTAFGFTINEKGYKVFPDQIRMIQGDGINLKSIEDILKNFKANNISADNIAFGMGGGLLQQVNRDTCGFAMKCSAIKVDGVWRDVQKNPVTDMGKKSKGGVLKVIRLSNDENESPKYVTVRLDNYNTKEELLNWMLTYYDEGVLFRTSFSDVRQRANVPFQGFSYLYI